MAISFMELKVQDPDPVRQGIIDVITNASVFLRRLYFIKTPTLAYRYNRQTALPGVAFRSVNGVYGAQDPGAVVPEVETLAVFGGPVQTDAQFADANARANRIAKKAKAAALFFDRNCIDGDPSADPNAFLGLNGRITGGQVMYAGDNGGPLTLDLVDELLDSVVGSDNTQKVLIMNKAGRRKLGDLYRPNAGERDRFVSSYEGAPVEVIDEDGDATAILGQDETRGNSAVTSSIYCCRFGTAIDEEYVQGIAHSNLIAQKYVGDFGEYVKDLVEGALGMGMFHGRAAARLAGVIL